MPPPWASHSQIVQESRREEGRRRCCYKVQDVVGGSFPFSFQYPGEGNCCSRQNFTLKNQVFTFFLMKMKGKSHRIIYGSGERMPSRSILDSPPAFRACIGAIKARGRIRDSLHSPIRSDERGGIAKVNPLKHEGDDGGRKRYFPTLSRRHQTGT